MGDQYVVTEFNRILVSSIRMFLFSLLFCSNLSQKSHFLNEMLLTALVLGETYFLRTLVTVQASTTPFSTVLFYTVYSLLVHYNTRPDI